MNGKYFLGTNKLVYAFDKTDPVKQQTANRLIKTALFEQSGCISYQVIQEFINVATRKFVVPLTNTDCRKYLDAVLTPLCSVFTSIELYHRALDIMERWQFAFYDALIIAGALQAQCRILYSEELSHGQKIEMLEIRNPFVE
ncbi:PIN domain-containing protein [candidate division KSB1 bacterium]|nr:PIN domain-containing protein [candidate division KSB1 bacterium]